MEVGIWIMVSPAEVLYDRAMGMQKTRIELLEQRVLALNPAVVTTGWEDVLIPVALARLAATSALAEAEEWLGTWIKHHLTPEPAYDDRYIPSFAHGGEPVAGLVLGDYCGNWGAAILDPAGCPEGLRDLVTTRSQSIVRHIESRAARGNDGVILHGGHSYSVWVDTLYYTAVPLARVALTEGRSQLLDEAITQCDLHAKHLLDGRTGLFFHDRDPVRRTRTNSFWARGNGWVVNALIETIRAAGSDKGRVEHLIEHYLRQVDALITLQDATGLWRSVPESAHAWIETSGSAMILTAIAAGVREGLLEEALIPVVQRGLLELSSWIRPEGIERVDPRAGALMGVQGPAGAGGWQTHKLATVGEYSYGTAFVLMLLAEMRGAGWE